MRPTNNEPARQRRRPSRSRAAPWAVGLDALSEAFQRALYACDHGGSDHRPAELAKKPERQDKVLSPDDTRSALGEREDLKGSRATHEFSRMPYDAATWWVPLGHHHRVQDAEGSDTSGRLDSAPNSVATLMRASYAGCKHPFALALPVDKRVPDDLGCSVDHNVDTQLSFGGGHGTGFLGITSCLLIRSGLPRIVSRVVGNRLRRRTTLELRDARVTLGDLFGQPVQQRVHLVHAIAPETDPEMHRLEVIGGEASVDGQLDEPPVGIGRAKTSSTTRGHHPDR